MGWHLIQYYYYKIPSFLALLSTSTPFNTKCIPSKRSVGFHIFCWQDLVTDETPACKCTLERVCNKKQKINYFFVGLINSKQSSDFSTVEMKGTF